jgi:cob(I)alamin adenosyltransferase
MSSRVTTKNGDAGTTRTLGGDVVSKGDIVIECTGRLDTLRAQTARVRLQVIEAYGDEEAELSEFLLWLLHVLFLLGTEINDPENKHPEYRRGTVSAEHLTKLEAAQGALEAELKLPKAFIITASTVLAAETDVLATVVRDLERSLVRLKASVAAFEETQILAFVNRLSDYFFIVGRYLERGEHQAVDYGVMEEE